MKRKVIQIADSTQVISLPKSWTVKNNIRKGDELDVNEQGNNLLVNKPGESTKPTEIEVKLDGLDKDSMIFLLRGLYIRGYDQIRFTFENPYITYYRFGKKITISSVIHKEITICPGLDIIQERGNLFVLKNISVSSIKEFDPMLKRIFSLLVDTANDLYVGAKNRDFVLLESFQDKHDNITRLINYNLKTLNTIGYSEYKNTVVLFNMLSSLDLVTDILKTASRDITELKMKLGPKAISILQKIYESMDLFVKLYYNFSFPLAEKFVGLRQEVINAIKKHSDELSKHDIRIVVMVEETLEVLRDLYSSRMSMQY